MSHTRCAIVGGGPGGMMLAYLLGRAGIPVTLLEAADDFDRTFRGDSLHPYTLELLDGFGLADPLLAIPHEKARTFRFHTPAGTVTTTDYSKLRSKFNYVALMPQARFLAFLAAEVGRFPGCEIRTGAKVTGLIQDDSAVRGVRFDHGEELTADVVIGADGRFSRMRRLADRPARSLGATTDLLWFRLPRHDSDPPDADVDLFFGRDTYV